ncbi:hypothetical protein [Parvicella tangerina]|nr:hypothetical protein [Parvicella tangerina]
MHHIENDTIAGTIGGTILAILPQLNSLDVTRTIILAAVGAVASFLVTQLCKWVWKRIKSKFSRLRSRQVFNRKSKEDDKN